MRTISKKQPGNSQLGDVSLRIADVPKTRIINLKDCEPSKAMGYINTCFLGWAATEGWNPGAYDMKIYFKVYPEAFYVLEICADNMSGGYEPAAILFAPYDTKTNQASVGAYISERTKYRGQGLGYKLWQHVFKQLDEQSEDSIRYLYGVPQQVSNYEKSGFRSTHNIIHYNMSAKQKYGPFSNIIESYDNGSATKDRVLEYLAKNYSKGFASFVDHASTKQNVHIRVSLDPKSGEIIGVGICRPLHDGHSYRYGIVTNKDRIGAADNLFRALNRNLTEKNEVVIDVRDQTPMQKIYEAYVKSQKAYEAYETHAKSQRSGLSFSQKNEVVSDVRDQTSMQKTYEAFVKSQSLRHSFFSTWHQRQIKQYGQHWTTEMNTLGKAQKERLDTNAEPSLETNFLRK